MPHLPNLLCNIAFVSTYVGNLNLFTLRASIMIDISLLCIYLEIVYARARVCMEGRNIFVDIYNSTCLD